MKRILLGLVGTVFFVSCGGSGQESRGGGTPLPQTPDPDPVVYTDSELLDKVQKQSIRYFWEYAESNSKLARERYHTDNPSLDQNIVTTGGSGFGFISLLVGIERGFLPRSETVSRMTTSLNFLENAQRFHGAWPHWIDGTTGNVKPFSSLDDGGDLVETAFLVQGLICIREYFKSSTIESEQALSQKADALWKGVEWDWYTQGHDALYWHWSENNGFAINMALQGFDETLIAYILAASSPTHPISKEVYTGGWARNGGIRNAGSQYGIPLVVNHNGHSGTVGPMFWSHYSFMALDPRGLSDDYVNYGSAVINHSKIMYQYALANPKAYRGYGPQGWGLTASYTRNSDGSTGYSAHSPLNDLGVISPTASLSSMPYIPNESMEMLRFLYNEKESLYVGEAGPFDAFSPQYNWVTPRYLAIDQGPITPMIENHRTGFVWNLFMKAPEIKVGLKKLGFSSTTHSL